MDRSLAKNNFSQTTISFITQLAEPLFVLFVRFVTLLKVTLALRIRVTLIVTFCLTFTVTVGFTNAFQVTLSISLRFAIKIPFPFRFCVFSE